MCSVNSLAEIKENHKSAAACGVHHCIDLMVIQDVDIPLGIVDTFLWRSCHAPSPLSRANDDLDAWAYPLNEILEQAGVGASIRQVQEVDRPHMGSVNLLQIGAGASDLHMAVTDTVADLFREPGGSGKNLVIVVAFQRYDVHARELISQIDGISRKNQLLTIHTAADQESERLCGIVKCCEWENVQRPEAPAAPPGSGSGRS